MNKIILVFLLTVQYVKTQESCKSSLPLSNWFSNTRNFTMNVENFPDDNYMLAFFMNFSIPIVTIVASILYFLSLLSFDKKTFLHFTDIVIENRAIVVIPYVLMQIFVGIITILMSWHLFDMLEKTICNLQSSACSSQCEIEQTIISQFLPLFVNILSWKPLFIGLSIIVSTIPVICLLLKIRFLTILVLYFSLSITTSTAGFFMQQLCGLYNNNKCDCDAFTTGMISLCRIPLYEISIFICISNVMLLLILTKKTRRNNNRKKIFRRATIQSSSANMSEMIDLPNNFQYNYRPKNDYVETTREKWYSMVGL